MSAKRSRFVMVEFFLRIMINILAMFTILFVILSTPKGEYEGVIDQTMNFTALVILLEIDNILGALFQKKIDIYDIGSKFAYDKESLSEEFNKCADFIIERKKTFKCQRKLEITLFMLLSFALYAIVTLIPVCVIGLYILVTPKTIINTS